MRTPPEVKFRKVYTGLSWSTKPRPELVRVEFTTYDGFLAWFSQMTHEGYFFPPTQPSFLNGWFDTT
ncbi:MAG: hypothetical protein KF861_00830 [Planctomycetaceae bacterium]|nr:hypothetical protein [Planctomycetaceae bacterium]